MKWYSRYRMNWLMSELIEDLVLSHENELRENIDKFVEPLNNILHSLYKLNMASNEDMKIDIKQELQSMLEAEDEARVLKRCPKCKIEKQISDFDGRLSCSDCRLKARQKRISKNCKECKK